MRARSLVILLALALPLGAQFKNGNQTVILELPRTSPRCELTQRIGLTDVKVVYHRPQTKGRTVFGDVVAYDRVWRAGANDNTTIEFTHPVKFEGNELPAGRYGFFVVPRKEGEWTVIFSKNSTSWGHFSFDPKEDALRVKVKPNATPMREELTFDFRELQPDTATLTLAWERVELPLHLAVDTRAITLASLRNELRHLPGYKAEAWYEAALYSVDNEFNYDEALQWIEHAIGMEGERFENLDLKAQILRGLGKQKESEEAQAKALQLAEPEQFYGYGERLIREKRLEEAKAMFIAQAKAHPDVWLNWYGLARVQVALGDRAAAKTSLETALAHTNKPPAQRNVRYLLDRLAAGHAID
ncbi:MAG TPA: DUF2911 domain-containing protein [Thermoanaerobaculia bacterium]|nr:DUF2911 domain-containing protein [Thermoanaerobaculia bacterium]